MFPEEVVLTANEKCTLARVKGRTGIHSWRSLCRWAISLSLREDTKPCECPSEPPSNIRLDWGEIMGLEAPLYRAALLYRLSTEDASATEDELYRHLRLHMARGISYLAAGSKIRTLEDLAELALSDHRVC